MLLGLSPGDVKTAVGTKNATALELHTGILTILWSVASPLAKSYQLGNEMQQMCATPTAEPSTTVSASVKTHDTEVHRLLTALASKLPANAAHAADNSLRLVGVADAGCKENPGEESPEDLLRQGRRWYDAPAGDVSANMACVHHYVAAADSVAGKLWQTARLVVARFKVWLIVAFLIAAGGIVLIFVGTKGTIGAGITAVLAAFGLTWKGIGEFFGRAAAKGEEQLWDAEIDWAIAYRFTVLRNTPADNQLKPRSKSSLSISRPKSTCDVTTSGKRTGRTYWPRKRVTHQVTSRGCHAPAADVPTRVTTTRSWVVYKSASHTWERTGRGCSCGSPASGQAG